jgi:hypothetical protein
VEPISKPCLSNHAELLCQWRHLESDQTVTQSQFLVLESRFSFDQKVKNEWIFCEFHQTRFGFVVIQQSLCMTILMWWWWNENENEWFKINSQKQIHHFWADFNILSNKNESQTNLLDRDCSWRLCSNPIRALIVINQWYSKKFI